MFYYGKLDSNNNISEIVQSESRINDGEHVFLSAEDGFDGSSYIGKSWPRPKGNFMAITRLAFRNRFTFAERVAIETATDSDMEVRVLMKDIESASFVTLTDQAVIDGLALLVSKGLIAQARADEIQSAPISESERP